MKTRELGPLTFNLHHELLLALLAAMETCWVFAVIVFLAAHLDRSRALTPLPFFIAYWLALVIGRALPQSRKQWIALQTSALVIAAVTVLAVVRAELFPAFEWHDFAWLPRALVAILSITRGFAAEHLVTAGVLYVFIRGLGFAQRPLTLWFIGFQFRLGIVVFFVLFVVAGIARPSMFVQAFDSPLWIFVYFFVSLFALALTRIEEMGGEVRYDLRWMITLLGGIGLVLFVGLGILQFFNPDTVQWLLQPLALIWWFLVAIIMLLAVPLGYLAGWIVDWLRPIFEQMAQTMQVVTNLFPREAAEALKRAPESSIWLDLADLLSRLAVPITLMIVAYFLVRGLNRRMRQIENETYVREAIGADEAERARRGATKKAGLPRSRPRHFDAESIRRIYAALVARAADAGLARRPAETPYDFLPRLTLQFPEQTEDIHSITEAYVAVHYGELAAPTEQVNTVRAAWMRVEKAIRTMQSSKPKLETEGRQ